MWSFKIAYNLLGGYLFIALLSGCATIRTITEDSFSQVEFIELSKEKATPISPNEVKFYKRRLDLPGKYRELALIKFEGSPPMNYLTTVAAEYGAEAVIIENGNAYLIKIIKEKIKNDKPKTEI